MDEDYTAITYAATNKHSQVIYPLLEHSNMLVSAEHRITLKTLHTVHVDTPYLLRLHEEIGKYIERHQLRDSDIATCPGCGGDIDKDDAGGYCSDNCALRNGERE